MVELEVLCSERCASRREQVSAEEFERLSLLLRLGHRKAGEPDGSPMDEGNSSFTGTCTA